MRLLDTFDPRGANTNASIIAHVNVLERMSGPSGSEPPTPAGAWPSDTYFTGEWALFVNDEAIQLIHVPSAHSDGDTMVFFRRSDVISAGDIFNTTGYPLFDPEQGGSVEGILDGLNRILEIAIPGENQEGGTAVIPGHGRISDETDVANYRDMVTIIRDRIAASIAAGMTLEQVQAERPTRDYDGIYTGLGGGSAEQFVAAVYRDLKECAMSGKLRLAAIVATCAAAWFELAAVAQFGPPPPPDLRSARERAPIDLTGQWVAVISEDWRWRMVTPPVGDAASIPLNEQGRAATDGVGSRPRSARRQLLQGVRAARADSPADAAAHRVAGCRHAALAVRRRQPDAAPALHAAGAARALVAGRLDGELVSPDAVARRVRGEHAEHGRLAAGSTRRT